MAKYISIEEFNQRIIDEHGYLKFKIRGEFHGVGSIVEVECLECGNVFTVSQAIRLLGKYGCVKCTYNARKTDSPKSYEDNLTLKHPSMELLSGYVSARTKIKFRCTRCGKEDEKAYNSLINTKEFCSNCHRPTNSITHEQFVERLQHIHGDNYTVLSKYENKYTVMKVRCNMCNTVREVTAYGLMQGGKCKECGRKSRTP